MWRKSMGWVNLERDKMIAKLLRLGRNGPQSECQHQEPSEPTWTQVCHGNSPPFSIYMFPADRGYGCRAVRSLIRDICCRCSHPAESLRLSRAPLRLRRTPVYRPCELIRFGNFQWSLFSIARYAPSLQVATSFGVVRRNQAAVSTSTAGTAASGY